MLRIKLATTTSHHTQKMSLPSPSRPCELKTSNNESVNNYLPFRLHLPQNVATLFNGSVWHQNFIHSPSSVETNKLPPSAPAAPSACSTQTHVHSAALNAILAFSFNLLNTCICSIWYHSHFNPTCFDTINHLHRVQTKLKPLVINWNTPMKLTSSSRLCCYAGQYNRDKICGFSNILWTLCTVVL